MITESDEEAPHDLETDYDDIAERLRVIADRFAVRASDPGSDALELLTRATALQRAAFLLDVRDPVDPVDPGDVR